MCYSQVLGALGLLISLSGPNTPNYLEQEASGYESRGWWLLHLLTAWKRAGEGWLQGVWLGLVGFASSGEAEDSEAEGGHGCGLGDGLEVVPVDVVVSTSGGVVTLEDYVCDGGCSVCRNGQGCISDRVVELTARERDVQFVELVVGEAGGKTHALPASAVPSSEASTGGFVCDAGELDDWEGGGGVRVIDSGSPESGVSEPVGAPVGRDEEIDGHRLCVWIEVVLSTLGVVERAYKCSGSVGCTVGAGDGLLESVVAHEADRCGEAGWCVSVGVPGARGLGTRGCYSRIECERLGVCNGSEGQCQRCH